MDQNRAPLLRALDEFTEKEYAYFAIPGHRYDRGMPGEMAGRFGPELYRFDLTEAPGLDDLHHASGVLKEAQELAAELFGADECRFSVGGTTALNEAMILAAAGPGEEILLSRDAHRSAAAGLILSGARPVWLEPEKDREWGISSGLSPETVEQALLAHPKAKAVFLTSPTYYGQCSDLETIAGICHERNVPLLVDAAHGSHLPFCESLPVDAVSAGADLTAVSLHKTGGSMTQSSLLLYRAPRVRTADAEGTELEEVRPLLDFSAVEDALKMTMSSSPSYILMASLDAARHQWAMAGKEMAEEAVQKAMDLRRALSEIPGIRVRGGFDLPGLLERRMDATRVVFSADSLSGTSLQEKIFSENGIVTEMADACSVTAVVTSANTDGEILQLELAAMQAVKSADGSSRPEQFPFPPVPETVLLPREAAFAEKEAVPVEKAAGRICADTVGAYPPGTAVLVPGEMITEEMTGYLTDLRKTGGTIQGLTQDGRIKVL